MRKWIPRLTWLVFLAVVIAEAYGFAVGNLFSQQVWNPVGQARLIRYTGLFVALATPVLILAPWGFAVLVAAMAAVYTMAATGLPALAAPVFFLISACALGSRFLRGHLLATLLGLSIYTLPMPILARLPVNYWWAYAVVLAVPVTLDAPGTSRRLASWMKALGSVELGSWGERAAFAVLVYGLSMHWLVVLKPEAGADALSMHLAVPANIAVNHVLTYEPSRFVWAVMPMGADFAYSIVYLLGGEFAARLLNFAMLLVLEGLLYGAVRRWLPRSASFLMLALFAASPMVQYVTGSLFVENLLAALVLGAMMALWGFAETGKARFLYAAGALFGGAVATKVGALALVVCALPFAACEARRRWKALLLAAVVLIAAASPPYAVAWWKTGNPLFPFLNRQFPSPLLDGQTEIRDTRFRQPLTAHTPYDLTFHTSQWYEGQDGSFGFQFLLLAPLGLLGLLVAPRRVAASAAVVAMAASAAILKSEPNARYLYAALPLLAVPFASLAGWLRERRRWLYRSLLVYVVLCTALNAWFLPASSYYHKDFYAPGISVGEAAPIRQLVAYFNQAHPHAAVLLTQDSFAAGFTGEVYENHWHQQRVMQQIAHAKDAGQLRQLLEAWQVQYLIARTPRPHHNLRPPVLREFLNACTSPEYEFRDFYVAAVEPACRRLPPPPPAPVAGPGTYDDFDAPVRYRGDWLQSDEFGGPYRHTVSYSDDAGAEVALVFEGTGVTYVFTKAPNRGLAEIAIDGASRSTVDLYSPTVEWQSRLEFGGLDRGRHAVVVRVTGRKQNASQGSFVDLDAFEVK